MVDFEISDLQRRLANLVRIGVVSELDEAKARVRVQVGDIVTGWLPWLTERAGENVTWSCIEPGEQVVLISPSGDLAQAVVLHSIYQSAYPANAGSKSIHRTTYPDGTVVEYDRESHVLKADVKGDVQTLATGNISAEAGGNISADAGGNISASAGGDITASAGGNLTADAGGNADVTASAINLTAPNVTINGALMVNGPASIAGALAVVNGNTATMSGNMNVTGAVSVTGIVTATTDVKAGAISLKSHTHGGDSGGSTSPPR